MASVRAGFGNACEEVLGDVKGGESLWLTATPSRVKGLAAYMGKNSGVNDGIVGEGGGAGTDEHCIVL